jgi:hypothetical protein
VGEPVVEDPTTTALALASGASEEALGLEDRPFNERLAPGETSEADASA